ncbi:U3 small nucleolar RNA-associated protein 25 [Elsinoe australis]|uniref:U3 small nucleolar RNA-associated protein 25 n=1 Tax=Elsinoe australis TaxID=40998 RepID=A0A4U7B6K5_9PEZI|nr:U3 small nucleolar RNA-associated protein 25 [Elsinoe australis]
MGFRGGLRGGNRGRTEKRRPVRNGEAKRNRVGEGKYAGTEQGREDSKPEDEFQDGVNGEQSSDEDETTKAAPSAYSTLLQSLSRPNKETDRPRKRRKISPGEDESNATGLNSKAAGLLKGEDIAETQDSSPSDEGEETQDGSEVEESEDDESRQGGETNDEDDEDAGDPYNTHFRVGDEVGSKVKAVSEKKWKSSIKERSGWKYVWQKPDVADAEHSRRKFKSIADLPLKQRLMKPTTSISLPDNAEDLEFLSTVFNYQSILHGGRTPSNGDYLRNITSLHTLNHILKGRDRVLRNNERIAKADGNVPDDMDVRDQGFTRPKVLILLETREQCYKWASAIMRFFEPEQRENWSRFKDSFHAEDHVPDHLPEDYHDIFEGNSDNDFRIGLKFTRKTIKFFSAFYQSDILLCSALGLRRIIAASDPKKRDHDFLSSIEITILDQAAAMLQQNWSHVTFVLSHLNLTPRDSHGTDFNRVRSFYLDSQSEYLRQTLIFSSHLTPELQSLFNTTRTISGRLKLTPIHPGAIATPLAITLKQTFNRFTSPTPSSTPDARFSFFTATLIPWINKISSLSTSTNSAGILVFIPSYLDFVRVRNYFAANPATQNIRFGQVSEYSSVSEQRRARSHFQTGRDQVLLYSGRAHHFNRYRIKGVKRVVWYAVPENERFWNEALGWVAETVGEGKATEGEVACRAVFGPWDGLALERVVGSERVGRMVRGEGGDVFDFV